MGSDAPLRWASVGCAAAGLALALVPFYVDVSVSVAAVAVVVGLVGLCSGVAGLRRGFSPVALSGATVSGLAALLGVVAVLVGVNAVVDARNAPSENLGRYGVNHNTSSVLDHELDVSIGTFTAHMSISGVSGRRWVSDSRLPVTMRNKLGEKRPFDVTIAGFDGNRQIAYATEKFVLGPGAEQTIDFFDLGVSPEAADTLKTAELRVIEAHSGDR